MGLQGFREPGIGRMVCRMFGSQWCWGCCKLCPLRVVPCWIDGVRARNCTPSPKSMVIHLTNQSSPNHMMQSTAVRVTQGGLNLDVRTI